MRFNANSPVYFDRHSISLKNNSLSIYTLEGRIRFQLALKEEDERRFFNNKLREIVMASAPHGYCLSFWFSDRANQEDSAEQDGKDFPEYLIVLPPEASLPDQPEPLTHA